MMKEFFNAFLLAAFPLLITWGAWLLLGLLA
jgi:hypothetical protein